MNLPKPSTRVQILIALLTIGIIPAAFMTLQGLHCAHEAILNSQERELQLLLDQKSSQMHHWLESRESDLRLLAFCPCVDGCLPNGSHENAQNFLNHFKNTNVHFESVAIYDTEWQLVAGAFGDQSHEGGNRLIQELKSDLTRLPNGVTWEKTLHPHKDGLGVHVGLILADENGIKTGYLVGALLLDEFVYSMSPNNLTDTSLNLALMDKTSLQSRTYTTQFDHSHHSNTKRLRMYSAEGNRYLGMTAQIDTFDQYLLAEIRYDEAFGLITFLQKRAFNTGLVVIIFTGLITLVLTKRIAMPYRKLMAFCQEIRDGNEPKRLEQFTSREADEVATAFNKMMDRLRDTRNQLVKAGSLAAIGELSASIVHEMRNPLNTIQMNLSALQGVAENNDKLNELFILAQRQTKRLQSMLNELLNFGAPVELHLQPTDIGVLLDQLLNQFTDEVAKNEIDVRVTSDTDLQHINVDRESFTRVLNNLIQNAIQHTPSKGEMTISLSSSDSYFNVLVQNSGTGLPEEMHDRIFRPFFTTREGGTGLGLAIVKKIIELHDGTIMVKSTQDRTSFIVHLPIIEGNAD